MPAFSHPGGSISVDASGRVYFVDTGRGVWRADPDGSLSRIHTLALHWMALDRDGRFAGVTPGGFDGGTVERVTAPGAKPVLLLASDFPITIGRDGSLYYVPFKRTGNRELIRRTPAGERSVFAQLPTASGKDATRWVNGIATAPDGSIYVTGDDEVFKVDTGGKVSALKTAVQLSDCAKNPPENPKLPFLRGLAVGAEGTVYAAATGCRTVIAISARGDIRTILSAPSPWSPTAVAVAGGAIYVLEYLHTPGHNRMEWLPRVRRIGPDGKVTVIANISTTK